MPFVHAHIGARWHVAGDALRCGRGRGGRSGDVVGMRRSVETLRCVAGGTGVIARRAQLGAMRIMAIRAGDARAIHLALQERTRFEDLIADLPIGEIEAIVEQRQGVLIGADMRAIRQDMSARMAGGALVQLGIIAPRALPLADAARVLGAPVPAGGVAEADGETVTWQRKSMRPCEVVLPGAVTGLTPHIEVGDAGSPAICGALVAAHHRCRVAFRTAAVPVEIARRPMQRVVRTDMFARIEAEPALPALRQRPRIPRQRQRLQAPPGQWRQILLQGIDAKGIGDGDIMPLGAHPKFAIAPEKG